MTEPFRLVGIPHEKRVSGFPLDTLSVDIETGCYFYDLEEKTVDQAAIDCGFRKFFLSALGKID